MRKSSKRKMASDRVRKNNQAARKKNAKPPKSSSARKSQAKTKKSSKSVARKSGSKSNQKVTGNSAATPRSTKNAKSTKLPTQKAASREVDLAFSGAPGIFVGLDAGNFPGLNPLDHWFGQSPYTWVGYYLNSPCHSATKWKPWMGNWRSLLQQGWGLALIYVGYQVDGCGSDQLSRAAGIAHGQNTISLLANDEQMPGGCTVFLDVEGFDPPLPADMADYVRGWVRALLDDATLKPGIYCSAKNADEVLLACQREYADFGLPSGRPLFWIARYTAGFDLSTSKPRDSGVSYADLWQGKANANETYDGFSIQVDENVSSSANPSNVRMG